MKVVVKMAMRWKVGGLYEGVCVCDWNGDSDGDGDGDGDSFNLVTV